MTRPAWNPIVPREGAALVAVVALFVVIATIGITWGLPSRRADRYLFGSDEPWRGEKILALAGAADKFSPFQGADVDPDPIGASQTPGLVPVTSTDQNVARIYLRYRLYSSQPDEMITMMALAGMRPAELRFDPRLYQYGGFFIYPVGALLKLFDIVGLLDVRSDVTHYLDHPDEFAKFYVVARLYSAAWGLFGVFIVFAITRRLSRGAVANGGGRPAEPARLESWGSLAGLLFALLPVVVCMSHEGKPHLPGAALMLVGVYFGLRCSALSPGAEMTEHRARVFRRDFRLMSGACGAALGTVLSALPILALIPLAGWQAASGRNRIGEALKRTGVGAAIAAAVYFAGNPYILINAFTNRQVLASNFGNSLAMYEIARIGQGFGRVLELTIEGATLPVVLLGLVGLVLGMWRRPRTYAVLVFPALIVLCQFVLLGAGKPGEYGRFGVFVNAALAIGAVSVLRGSPFRRAGFWRSTAVVAVVVVTGIYGLGYLANFRIDAASGGTRWQHAEVLSRARIDPATGRCVLRLVAIAEPAPYCFPPVNFARTDVYLHRPTRAQALQFDDESYVLIEPIDRPRGIAESHAAGPRLVMESMSNVFDMAGAAPISSLGVPRAPWGASWLDPRVTPISWANKPFFNSLFYWKSSAADPPILGR